MHKVDLVNNIAEKGNLSKRDADNFVNLMFDRLISGLLKEERIEIRGLGSWNIRKYEGYEGRNPKTGEKIMVDSKRLPHWKAGVDLLKRINDSHSEKKIVE